MMNECFWDRLGDKPVVIYGTGNGADKIIDVLEARGVRIDAVFASDGFVRDRVFRSYRVRSYSDVISEYGDDISILAAFGSGRDEVLSFLEELDARHDLYIPEVPLFCESLTDELFDSAYYKAHKDELEAVRTLLSDEESRLLFDDIISHRLTGKLGCLKRTEEVRVTLASLPSRGLIKTVIDGGAFCGDTAELFADVFPECEKIIAVEPDPRTFAKLSAKDIRGLVSVNAMLGGTPGEHVFAAAGSRGSSETVANKRKKEVVTKVTTADMLEKEFGHIDMIKLDTEGWEAPALDGATRVLESEPLLSVSLYHRTADLFTLPLRLSPLYPGARFILRRPRCVPEWDLNLYVIPKRFII